jgi:Uma2 family endonuclease
MASASRQFESYITPEEHERLEHESGEKYEWHDGEVFAMAGGTPAHNTISMNISGSLYNQLRGKPCRPWGSDQQVKALAGRSVVYPDISVACPPFEWDEKHRNALTNPVVVIEVLSPSTAEYDRRRKFDLYASIPSLRHYILVASGERYIEHFERTPAGWLQHAAPRAGDCITLADIECSMCLEDVYERLDFPDEASSDADEEFPEHEI